MSKIERRIEVWLWTDRPGRSRLRVLAFRIARYAWALIEDLVAGDLGLHSTSLVYSTILAVVPLLAFSFAVLKGFGLQRELEPLLRNVLSPLGAQADALANRVVGFVNNVSSSGLASVSLLLLVLAALMMAQKVEVSLNAAWNVDRPRTIGRRFTGYVSFML
ncbi:MAG TPA: YhjD/YihY/BrkB family envelope integrity protein, partial [Gammaproteobacteria bacterium]|nr:YhjD/YihY/BrkB family envelope integrity protein [Gammaproteobacteria bacterium]